MISIINNILLAALAVELLTGVVLIARHNDKSKHRTQILFVLSLWAVLMIYYLVARINIMIGVGDIAKFNANVGVCNMRFILDGILCFFAIISYPFIALYPRIVRFKNMVIALSPLILLIAIYFVWHFVAEVDPFYIYRTADLFWASITTTPVILRLLMIALFVVYVIFSLLNVWRIIPIYSELSRKYYSQASYNIRWIRILIIYYALVSTCIILRIFVNSIYFNTVCLLFYIAVFFYLIEKTLFTKDFEDVNKLGVQWTFKNGWYIPSMGPLDKHHAVNIESAAAQIDRWMREKKPYTQVHFTSDDILKQFSMLNNDDLRKVFKSRGTTLHSYIREYRIKEACRIIEVSRDVANLKEVCHAVGFSHYSSFARAFTQLVGVSPSDYMQQQNQKTTQF